MTRNTWLLIIANFISKLGDWALFMAVSLFIFDKTKLNTMVGLVTFAQFLAGIICAPFLLKYADQFNKKKTLIGGDLAAAFIVLIWSFYPTNILFCYISIFLIGAIAGVSYPLKQSLLPRTLVGKEFLDRANGIMILFERSNFLLGAAGGATLLYFVGIKNVLFINLISFLISATLLCFLPNFSKGILKGEEGGREKTRISGLITELKEKGIMRRLLLPMIAIGISFGAINGLEVGYCVKFLNLNQAGVGWVLSASGVGLLIGASIISVIRKSSHLKIFIASGIALVASNFLFGITSIVVVAVIGMTFSGLFNAIYSVKWRSYIQEHVDRAYQARAFTLLFTILNTVMITFMLFATLIADEYSERSVLVGTSGLILSFLIMHAIYSYNYFAKIKLVLSKCFCVSME